MTIDKMRNVPTCVLNSKDQPSSGAKGQFSIP